MALPMIQNSREGMSVSESIKPEISDVTEFNRTDSGNAELLVSLYGQELRYDHTRGKWFIWNGQTWEVDKDKRIIRIGLNAIRERLKLSALVSDSAKRKEHVTWSLSSESGYKIKALLEMAESMEPIATTHDKFDIDPFLMGCSNGIINLRTGKLLHGQPELMISKSNNIDYDPSAKCPRWEKFLDEVFQGNTDIINFVQLAIGYSLTGDVSEHCLFLLYGTGENGKSVFLDTILSIMGDYGKTTTFSTFESTTDNARRPSNDVAALEGKRVVVASEVNEKSILSEARIKSLTGDDLVTARYLFKEEFTYSPTYKIFFGVNHKPRVNDNSHAFWRRVKVIPFERQFSGPERDRKLKEKLISELPGILSWAVEGCLAWQKYGLTTPEIIDVATNEWRDEMNIVRQFIQDKATISETAKAEATALYKTYLEWTNEYSDKPMSKQMFFRRLSSEGFKKSRDTGPKRKTIYSGIGLLNDTI